MIESFGRLRPCSRRLRATREKEFRIILPKRDTSTPRMERN